MKIPNEVKAGVVILIGVAACMFFMSKTIRVTAEPYDIKTYFRYAGDLKKDAVVKLSGIGVGRISNIRFVYDNDKTMVECTLSLSKDARIRKDSVAYIASAGFVGDSYVGITPGDSPELVKQNDTIASEDPVQMRELFKKADKIADGLDKTLGEAKTLMQNLNGVVTDNRQGLKNTVTNLEGLSQNFKEFSEDIKAHPWKLLFKGE
ncbi:MAG: MCE family protein [Candidatus Omnitrophica bacterium]|nr:MCE family protein [Candidatus Omnitrophota bacterium]